MSAGQDQGMRSLSTMILSNDQQMNGPSLALKRIFDIVGALVLLLCFSPLFLVIAIAIKLDSPGPVLFKRRMAGRKGRPFTILKFRTMVNNAHQLLEENPGLLREYQGRLKINNDPRATRVGRVLRKTTIDELPQLVNVLKGEMSLVGPRPLGDLELARYGDYRDKVLGFKPGMAGLWIASGRHTLSFERRLELDMEYIDHWSIWLDIKIFLNSIMAVLRMTGAM